MIQITSNLVAKPEYRDEVLRIALEHVKASRLEPGCISHNVFIHPEQENSFFFFERWRDQEAIDAHFKEPYSIALVEQLKVMAAEPMSLQMVAISGETDHTVG